MWVSPPPARIKRAPRFMSNQSDQQASPINGFQVDGQSDHGRLTIFLGYAAGVGKTRAMLEAAHQRLADDLDLVIGHVESHKLSEDRERLAEFEQIPYRISPAGAEMDIDAILARWPQIVLVDKLAHTNLPGSRHLRRYQDVLELLNAGIDVYTTVDIQQIESLNDIVVQITGLTVTETVPDHILDNAHDIVIVDLPVDELLLRLEAGKIQVPGTSEQTLRQFFRPGNLTALREMTLRRAADRVDQQMRAYMHAHDISGPWPANEYLMVCVSVSPLGQRLVRTTRRLARALGAEWVAAYVETPAHDKLPEAAQNQVTRTLKLAQELGGKTIRLSGRDIAETLITYANNQNVTKIVVGKPLWPWWRTLLRRSIVGQMVYLTQDLDLYIISSKLKSASKRPKRWRPPSLSVNFRSYLLSAALVLLATFIGLPLRPFVNPTNLVMPYLIAVMLAAVWFGRYPAITASLLGVIAFDVVFVPPYYTLAVDDGQYLLTFAGLLAVGLVISTLAAQAREHELIVRHREAHTTALYELSQKLSKVSEKADIARIAISHIYTTIGSSVALYLPQDGRLVLQASSPDFPLDSGAMEAAEWVFRQGRPAGRYTTTLISLAGHYLPLLASGRVIGVMAITFPPEQTSLADDHRRLLRSLATQIALAMEKDQLAKRAQQARLLEETEKLQSALLNSVSHDLRTPLASITGVLSSLREDSDLLSESARQELIYTAWEESWRLNRLVANLLDMTRLESGAMKVKQQLNDVIDLVGATLANMPMQLKGREVAVSIPEELPPITIDFVLMMQVLVNLLENAVKYTPPESAIEIDAYQAGNEIVIRVMDRGPGLPEEKLEAAFDKFFRGDARGISGTGLGLSIAKGIVEAHSGRIWVENRAGGGAVFSLALPLAGNPPASAG